jgi:hypothetical protein
MRMKGDLESKDEINGDHLVPLKDHDRRVIDLMLAHVPKEKVEACGHPCHAAMRTGRPSTSISSVSALTANSKSSKKRARSSVRTTHLNYGLLAGATRKAHLALARELLAVAASPDDDVAEEPVDVRPPCPCCGGQMVIVETFERWRQPRAPPDHPAATGRNDP